MKKLILLSIVLLSLLVAPLSEVFSQARLINYQGNILNDKGAPYEGPVQITFELYTAEFGGTQVWSEIQNVTLNTGYFNVYLGSVSPFASNFNFNRELWLQVTVGKGAPYQRTRLSMVPYSGYSDRSAVAGFAEDIPDGSVTLAKLADEVKTAGGDLQGFYPNPTLRPGAILENIPDGSITQEKLSPNVTTRPSGPASGDLTGFYPDPLIAAGAVKTDRLADGAVTNVKIADFTIQYNKLQNANGPIGTILGWDGTKWIETNVPAWEKGRIKAIVAGDGAYVTNVADGENFLTTTVGIADNGVTTAKIANDAVTYAKLQNAAGAPGTILGWDGTNWIETTVPAWEADAVIGNEVLNATPNRGLVRAGAGTAASPYTLGIAVDGVITDMIANQAVTLNKLVNGAQLGHMIWWDAVTNAWKLTGGAAAADNQVLRWVDNGVTRQPVWSNDDAIIGNEITDVVAGGGLQRLGAGTTASPYTVGVAPAGIVTSMIADDAVTYDKLQNAAGPIGTILGWNGGHWVETNVAAWEKGKVMAVTAGAGTTVTNTTDAEGFISAEVGIADGGVTNTMLADGAVSLSKLAPGTQIGQIMWWDQAANQWRFSTGAAPTQDQVIKWVDAGGTLTPRWAPDDMTIPFAKTITENAQTLFSLENNGNSDVMSLTTTGKGDGLVITVPDDLVGGGHALHVNGGGLNQPSLVVNRTSQYGLPTGAATINATVNTLDAETTGLLVNTLINDDGNNNYDVDGIRGNVVVNNGVNTALYTGVWGDVEANTGTAVGVWGDAGGVSTGANVGVLADAENGNQNIGVFAGATTNSVNYINGLGANFSAGVVATNGSATANDYGVYSTVSGNATGSYFEAGAGSSVVGINESANNPSVWAYNTLTGPALWAIGNNPATNGFAVGNSVGTVYNTAGGRALYVEGGSANDENGGLPFLLDPANNDDAALIVANPNAASMGGGAAFATAIKTYGDIWANSTIGASQIVGLDKVIVGNFLIPGMFIEILPPAAPGAPLVIDGDVDITGNLEVEDIMADDITADVITANTLNAALGTFDNLQVNINANVDGHTTLNTLATSGNATVGGTFGVTGATTLGNTLTVAGATQVNNTLGVTGATTLGNTLTVAGASTLNGATQVNNTLGVTGATTLANTLAVAGATTMGSTLDVANNVVLNSAAGMQSTTVDNLIANGNATIAGTLNAGATTLASLVVTGTSNLQGAATLGNTLTVAGATTLNGATQINNTLGVTGATTLGNNLTVAGTTNLNGPTNVNNNLLVTGTAQVNGATTLGNTLTVAGNTTLNANLAVVGNYTSAAGNITLTNGTINAENADFDNTLNVDGNTTLGGTLTVTGATTLNNTLAVAGNANFNGASVTTSAATALNLGNELFTNGSAGIANNAMLVSRGPGLSPTWTNVIDQLTVNGLLTTEDLLVNDDATITGDLTVNGDDVFINADVTMVGTFDLTGSMIADDLTILNSSSLNGTTAVSGTFGVTGPSTFTGTVGITGNTTVTGTVGITGNTTVTGATQLNGTLGVTGNTTLNANLQVDGTSDLRGTIFNTELGGGNEINIIDNTNITGNLTVTGGPGQGVISGKELQIAQNATIQQNLTVNQNATINQNFTVAGHTSINTLDVAGNIINPVIGQPIQLFDDVQVTGSLNVTGSLVVLGDITATNLNATNNVNAGNDVNAINNVNAGNNLNVGNNANVIGNYNSLNGNITLTNGTINAENATIDNNLAVTNNATVGGTLGVTGATTLGNTLTVAGATQVNNTLGVTGATTLGNTLTVAGATVVNNTFNATGNTTLGADLAVANNATVGGTLGVTGAITGASLTTVGNVTAGGDVAGVNGVFSGNVSGVNGTFSGAITGASLTTTGNITAGGVINGQLVNSLTNGAGIAAFTYNNTAGATVAIDNNAVTSAMIADGTIMDVDVNAAAAIAGTKINPNFGAQNVVTTGSITGNTLVSTTSVTAGTTVTATGDVTSTNGNVVATLGDLNAPAGVINTGNVGGSNILAGNLQVGGTSTFNNTVTISGAASDLGVGRDLGVTRDIAAGRDLSVARNVTVGEDLTVAQQTTLLPYTHVTTANPEDLTAATVGQAYSFLIYQSVNPIGAGTYPSGTDGSILYVYNNSGAALTFGVHAIPNGQVWKFIYISAAGGWVLVQ